MVITWTSSDDGAAASDGGINAGKNSLPPWGFTHELMIRL